MKELSDRDVIRKINPPRAGSTKGQNMFKGYLEDQKNIVIESLELLKDVVARAYSDNRPLLASKQMMDEVFKIYKAKAQNELQSKFDAQMA